MPLPIEIAQLGNDLQHDCWSAQGVRWWGDIWPDWVQHCRTKQNLYESSWRIWGGARLIQYSLVLWVKRAVKKNLSPQEPTCPLLSSSSSNDQTLYLRILSINPRKKSDQYDTVPGSVLVYFFSAPYEKNPTQKKLKTTKNPDTYLSTPRKPKSKIPLLPAPNPDTSSIWNFRLLLHSSSRHLRKKETTRGFIRVSLFVYCCSSCPR